jgi:hypothetical protein
MSHLHPSTPTFIYLFSNEQRTEEYLLPWKSNSHWGWLDSTIEAPWALEPER